MASYSTMSTIPAADVETEQPLLKRDVKLNVKTVLAGAAGAAFILGAAAATAVTASAAPKQMNFGASFFPVAKNIELAGNHDECLMFGNEGTPLRVKGCNKHGGQYRQVLNVKDNIVRALHDDLELVRREAHKPQVQSTKEAAHDDEARRDEEEPPGRRHGCFTRTSRRWRVERVVKWSRIVFRRRRVA